MFRAEGERRSFSVVREVTVIGRREDCDLRIPVSEVSRKHCRVLKDATSLRLEDLGSSNGSFHNGQRVQGTIALEAGDSIQVGPVVFVVQIDGVPPEDALEPFTERAAHSLTDSITKVAAGPSDATADDNPDAASSDAALELEPTAAADADQIDFNVASEPEQAASDASDDVVDLDADAQESA
jgi:pSer/pThr/pTyr-binding forkhead associated (FHA) protein